MNEKQLVELRSFADIMGALSIGAKLVMGGIEAFNRLKQSKTLSAEQEKEISDRIREAAAIQRAATDAVRFGE